MRTTVLLLAVLLALPACGLLGSPTVDEVAEVETAPSPSPTARATADPQPSTEPPGQPSSPDAGGGIACPETDQVAIAQVIADQLDDFAADDFAAALEHASPGFRATFTPELFEETIIEGFPIVATVRDHTFVDCTIGDVGASATVEVVGDPGVQRLGYVLERVDDAWLIGGAFPLSEVQLETA